MSGISAWLRAILMMIASASLFAVVDGVSKILADDQSVGQIVWARYSFACCVPTSCATRSSAG
ncbi:MAG: hypothetical protein E6G87_15175 [Alphaproteobacteria bacterium]|nr:MAG: hypothetical protein E6G87_15175 [Alphaproteobacteria bacterium]